MTLTTQQRVIETSTKLFNAHGIEAVSIGQISETLKISPGNFTYHYKRKADLVRHQFDLLEQRLQEIFETFPVQSEPERFAAALYDLLELVYGSRFLFLGARYLIRNKLISATRYKRMIERSRRSIIGHVDRLIDQQLMEPTAPPYSVELLVDAIWWQWLGWLLTTQIVPPREASPRKLVADALIAIILLNPHYAGRPFFRAVRQKIAAIGDGEMA